MPDLPASRTIQLLTAATVLLAAGCIALAWTCSDRRAEPACRRDAFESGEIPPDGVC